MHHLALELMLSLMVSEFLAEMGPSPDGITVDSIMRHWADEFGPDLPEKQLIDAAADGDSPEVLIPTCLFCLLGCAYPGCVMTWGVAFAD